MGCVFLVGIGCAWIPPAQSGFLRWVADFEVEAMDAKEVVGVVVGEAGVPATLIGWRLLTEQRLGDFVRLALLRALHLDGGFVHPLAIRDGGVWREEYLPQRIVDVQKGNQVWSGLEEVCERLGFGFRKRRGAFKNVVVRGRRACLPRLVKEASAAPADGEIAV